MVWADPMIVGTRVRHWASHRSGKVTARWMWGGPPTADPDDNMRRTKVSIQYDDGQFTPNRRRGAYYLQFVGLTDVDEDQYDDRSHLTVHYIIAVPPAAPAASDDPAVSA